MQKLLDKLKFPVYTILRSRKDSVLKYLNKRR
nr:MAG TPA: hypothetical protein [Caudoviricetes sp.]